MESLAGPRAKLERAREHFAALSAEFASWQGTLTGFASGPRRRLRLPAPPALAMAGDEGVPSRVPVRRYRRAHDGEETPCPPLSPITT